MHHDLGQNDCQNTKDGMKDPLDINSDHTKQLWTE